MNSDPLPDQQLLQGIPSRPTGAMAAVVRLQSRELFAYVREVEIEHGGRIYKLRITQQNKLILTA